MKKVACITTLVFFICIYAKSQKQDSGFKKWMVAINFEPDFTYRILQYSSGNTWIKDLRNKQELAGFSFNAGLSIRYGFNSRWSVEAGLQIANYKYLTTREKLLWSSSDKGYPAASKTKFLYQYIEFPVKAYYHWQFKKINLYTLAGISVNNLNSRKATLIIYSSGGSHKKETDKNNYIYNNHTYSAILGCGISLPLSRRIGLNVEPTYRQNFTTTVKEKAGKEYLYAIGINTELIFRFKRKAK